MLDIVFRNITTDKSFKEGFFISVLNVAIDKVGFGDKTIEMSLNLVGSGRIKELNNKYRGKNKVTDVLSFPLRLASLAQGKHSIEKYDIISLGDIFICLPYAKKQARQEGIEVNKLLSRLIVHGFLHLAGYDHERTTQDAKTMSDLEDKILDKLKLNKILNPKS
jgi:probable rRNA maturation factor